MAQTATQSTVNKIEMRLRGKGRGSIVFQQDYADCGTPSAVKSTFHRIVPNEDIARQWQDDYKFMCEHMIYGQVPSFEELIDKLRTLNEQIRQLNYQKS